MEHVHTVITHTPLDPARILKSVEDDRCGAVAVFHGIVRNHDGGLSVTGIDYSTHPQSDGILRDIGEHFVARPGIHAVEIWHRTGSLSVGDYAMVVAVAAEHRGQAFSAVEAIVDEVKARLPMWKKQQLNDGSHHWSGLA